MSQFDKYPTMLAVTLASPSTTNHDSIRSAVSAMHSELSIRGSFLAGRNRVSSELVHA